MEYQNRLAAMQGRVDAQIPNGDEEVVIYSAYLMEEGTGLPIDNLDVVAVAGGPYLIRGKGDDFFGNGEEYASARTYWNPTMLELAVEANKAIIVTDDRHHVYFEGFSVRGDMIYLHFGS